MRISTLVYVFLAALLIGCGGASVGVGGGSSPTSRTREAIKSGYLRALIGAGALGAGPSGGFGGGGTTGGSSSGSTGTSGGFPGFGFLVHDYSSPGSDTSGSSTGRTIESTSGSTTGTTGGDLPGPSFYYDDYLNLWLDSSWTDTSSTVLLYEDEQKSKPAGSFVTTYPSGWKTYPYSYLSKFEITAGSYAGAKGSYESVAESESAGHMAYTSTWPGYGQDSGESSYTAEGGTWSYASTLTNGTWYHDTGSYTMTKSTFTSEDSSGYRRSYTYLADGSGSGRIEGPDPGLPAIIEWDVNGHTKITYADGTSEEWDAWSGGTTGSTAGDGGTVTGSTGDVGTSGGGGTRLAVSGRR